MNKNFLPEPVRKETRKLIDEAIKLSKRDPKRLRALYRYEVIHLAVIDLIEKLKNEKKGA